MLHRISDFVYNYDLQLIGVFAAFNVIVFFVCLIFWYKGNKILKPSGSIRFNVAADNQLSGKSASKLQKYKALTLFWYTWYANITAIFPLLGILGTVAALINNAEDVDMMAKLMVALDTTLAGVFLAILSKLFDPFLSGKIGIFIDDADYVLRNINTCENSDDK